MTTPRQHTWRIVRDGGLYATCVHCGRMEMLGHTTGRAVRLVARGAASMALAHQVLVGRWIEGLCDDGDPCTTESPAP